MKRVYVLIFLILSFSIIVFAFPAASTAQRAPGSFYNAVVSTHTLRRGHEITSADVELISSTRFDARSVTDVNLVIGKALLRTIGANTTIKRDYLLDTFSKIERVDIGNSVTLVVEREGLRVSARGRLKGNAKIGEIVNIENLSSGKILSGRLIDINTVVVNF